MEIVATFMSDLLDVVAMALNIATFWGMVGGIIYVSHACRKPKH